MNQIASKTEINPFLQTLLLLTFAVVGGFVFALLSLAIIWPVYGTNAIMLIVEGNIGPETIGPIRIFQMASSIGIFLLPPIVLARIEGIRLNQFYSFINPKIKLLGAVLLLMAVSMPFMEYVTTLNQQMVLPESLKSLEHWMRKMEDEAMRQTYLLLKGTKITDLLVNLLMIAILPGIAEELMFRGGVQRTFTRAFTNPHVAIWAAAILFSAIHFQFFGFIPRMLLGAAFGYIYYWTGSIWYAMFAHFLNNAYAVFAAWYLQKQNIPLESVDKTLEMPVYGYIISFVLTAGALWMIKRLAEEQDGTELG